MEMNLLQKGVNASILTRVIAFIIDLMAIEFVIVWPFSSVIESYIIGGSFAETMEWISRNEVSGLYPLIAVLTALMIAYFAVFEYKYGQTPGKMIMKIKVISLTKNMEAWQAVARALFLVPLYPLNLVDLVYVFFNQDNQRILEYFSKTKTVGE